MKDIEKEVTTNLHSSVQGAITPAITETSSARGRRPSCSSVDSLRKSQSTSGTPCNGVIRNDLFSKETDQELPSNKFKRPGKISSFALPAVALLILAWWISSIILPTSKDRWIVQSLWAWFFVLTIAFRFIPASIVSRPVSAIWTVTVEYPFSSVPHRGRLAIGWFCALAITFGSAFGFERPEGTVITDRVISLVGVYFFQLCIYGHSQNRTAINWTRVPVSLIFQQALALLVLKSQASFAIFRWFNTAVADFQNCALQGAELIFDLETITKGWFFVVGLAVIIFLAAWVQMLYFLGWIQWLTKQFAWFGQRVFSASGAETFVALWSPWFGQANSALLIGPYIESMTDNEIFAVMAISMSSISSHMIDTYANLLVPQRNLIAQSAMIIPASIINAKVAFPESQTDAPVTCSRESTHAARRHLNLKKSHDLLDALTNGAWTGLRVAGSVLANFFVVISLLVFVNGIMVWIFRGFGVRNLDLHQVTAGPLFPLMFFLGVPRREIWRVSYIMAGKLLVNSDFAFAALQQVQTGPVPLSARGYSIITFALANTANLSSLGVQVGVMTALAPSRKRVIARGAIPALLIATFTTLQTTAIAASVL